VTSAALAPLSLLGALAAAGGTVEKPGFLLAAVLLSPASLVLGVLVSTRRPGLVVAPLLSLLGLVLCLGAATDLYLAAAARAGGLPWSGLLVPLSQGAWVWLYVPVGLLLLCFPDGRPLGLPGRALAIALPVVATLFTALAARAPGPFAAPHADAPHTLGTSGPWAAVLAALLLPTLLGLLLLSGASSVVRFRRSDGVVRAQLKWLFLAALAAPAALLLGWAGLLLLGDPRPAVVGVVVMAAAVPAAVSVALLRHDLYDVDRVLSATVGGALQATAALALWTAGTLVLGLSTGRDAVLVSTAVTGAVLSVSGPARRRLQRQVDRRLYPLRAEALAAVTGLRRRVDTGLAEPEQLQQVLRDALTDPHLVVGHVLPGGSRPVGLDGTEVRRDGPHVPVRLGGADIGVLVVDDERSLPALRAAAGEAALLMEVSRLRFQLGSALLDAEQSRSRLLRAGDLERRRVVRDLHDGAQQRLVALGMSLRLAQRRTRRDGDVGLDLDGLLEESVAQVATAVGELRGLAHGLRPSALDDGLGPALTTLVGSLPIPTELSVDECPLSDDVTATAWFVASEGIANALKHAGADRLVVTVRRGERSVHVSVSDDGRGGADGSGDGVAGLRDRVAAAGGRLVLDSPPGRGTRLEAVLPCVS